MRWELYLVSFVLRLTSYGGDCIEKENRNNFYYTFVRSVDSNTGHTILII